MSTVLRCSLGDLPIIGGGLVLPPRGNWLAVVSMHLPDGGAALAELSAAELRFTREDRSVDVFTGAVRHSAVDPGREVLTATIVGGAGRLGAELEPRDHAAGATEIPAGLIARSICDDAGELLADGVEAALDAFTVHHWTRVASSGQDALDLLAEVLGLGWHVLPSGRVWIGAETWPVLETSRRVSPRDPGDGAETWATDGAPILAGVTLDGMRVAEARYQLGGVSPRCLVRSSVAGDAPRTADRSRYLRSYTATVISQDSAGGVELVPDDPSIGSIARALRGIPLRLGLPGCVASPSAGTRVRLAFDDGDPRSPVVVAFEESRAHAAPLPLALVGDSCGYLSALGPIPGSPILFTLADAPTGAPGEVKITIAGPGHAYVKGVAG
ncbi:MAG: hypothetical protein KBF21_17075 [Thermoanaerobaculia bacterium]|nr:hypothetical protein [Thermoanaerobaculia bacterium]